MCYYIYMKNEIWKDISKYKGLYQVSNYGNVRSLPKEVTNGLGTFIKPGRILKPFNTGHGYLCVKLTNDRKETTEKVHRLVAITFIPNADNLRCVCHIDDVRTNNRVDNLFWGSGMDNYIDCERKNRATNPRKQIRCICTGEVFESVMAASRVYTLNRANLRRSIKTGGTCMGYRWEYVTK